MKKLIGWTMACVMVAMCVGLVVLETRHDDDAAPVAPANLPSGVKRVQDRGIDPSRARMQQLLPIAKEEAAKWQLDAKLVSIRVQPDRSGLINMMQAAPAADFLWWSAKADDWFGVMFRAGGEIRPYEHAEAPSKTELPAKFIDIEEALRRAEADGWKQNVNRAMLAWHSKKGIKDRCAWMIIGDGSVPDDRVYCIDAVRNEPFLAKEMEEILEVTAQGDRAWLKDAKVQVLQDRAMQVAWQAVPIGAGVYDVLVPIRVYTDPEREKVLAAGGEENPSDVPAGPGVKLTTEERRIFRSVFGEKAVDIDVEPGMVIVKSGFNIDRDAVVRAVGEERRKRLAR